MARVRTAQVLGARHRCSHMFGGSAQRLRDRVNPYSDKYVAGNARARRIDLLQRTFPELGSMRVLDLGGVAAMWQALPVLPEQVVLMNEHAYPVPEDGVFVSVTGDACDPPSSMRSERFDLVFSNSVIEHVGGHQRRQGFAETVHTHAPRHWIQTPNRYFPLEPHWLFPGFQFLPTRAKAGVTRVWPGQFKRVPEDPSRRMAWALSIELLTRSELAFYFPTSDLLTERLLGLPKSFVAVKR
jgi:hypothetical protein